MLDATLSPIPEVVTAPADWDLLLARAAALPADAAVDDRLVAEAEVARQELPASVRRALHRFAADSGRAGALLLRGVPVGALPRTPAHPTAATSKDRTSELVLLAVARSLGEPVGYRPEHGGAIVQNLLPVAGAETTQTSTSSAVDLEFHTETAFHPHRPHHLLLACLRGDDAAGTYLCSIRSVLGSLTREERAVLAEPRFRTRVDASFGGTPDTPLGPPVSVLSGDPDAPTLLFDADLMVGTDPEADAALHRLHAAATEVRRSVVLTPGDLLVVDNHACIHGRSSFAARYDGTDRWLQRAFVVDDLVASAPHRTGRIIDVDFDARDGAAA